MPTDFSNPSASPERKILLICRKFPPVRNSGTIRVEAFARYLPKHGYRPTIMTSLTPPELISSPDKVLPDDQRLEITWRLPKNFVRRRMFRIPLAFSVDRYLDRIQFERRAVQLCRDRNYRPDVVLGSCQPGDSLLIGQAIAQEFGCPFIADYRDPWSFAPRPEYPHWVDFRLERGQEGQLLQKTRCVVVTCEASKHLIHSEFRVPLSNIHVIPNGYEPTELEDPETFEPIADKPDKFHIVYTGEIGRSQSPPWGLRVAKSLGFRHDPLQTNWLARSPRWFLEGLKRFLQADPAKAESIRVWLIGDAKVASDPFVSGFPYPNVIRVYPRVPQKVAVGATLQANLLLFLQLETFYRGQPLCMFIAGKLYSYLASGKRILAGVQTSENTQLIERFQAGTCVSPTSETGFAEAIAREFDRWKSGDLPPTARRIIPEFERASQVEQLAQLIDSLLPSPSRTRETV